MLWNSAKGICCANGAVQDKSRISAIYNNDVQLAYCDTFGPVLYCSRPVAIEQRNIAGLYFFLQQGLEQCWATFCLCSGTGALLQLDVVHACVTEVVWALLPLVARREFTGIPSWDAFMKESDEVCIRVVAMPC